MKMVKIKHEEYDILKGLDDKWKWIARDSNYSDLNYGHLFAYANKPSKNPLTDGWKSSDGGWLVLIDNDIFQFIQWEDEEPYNIQELIEEYESSKEIILHEDFDVENLTLKELDGFKQTLNVIKESEETEVKKDIKWAKEEIKNNIQLELDHRYGLMSGEYIGTYMLETILNQLDEPEVLSQKWIDEHKAYAREYNIGHYIQVEHLQNLLVPKQDEHEQLETAYKDILSRGEFWFDGKQYKVVPKQGEPEKVVVPAFVAEYLDFAKSDTTLMRVLELANTRNEWPKWEKEYDWIEENHELFARAWLDGHTVEKEKKYYVDLETAAYVAKWDGDGSVQIYTDSVSGSDEYELHLTEQEIKDYDERFWPFAEEVTE